MFLETSEFKYTFTVLNYGDVLDHEQILFFSKLWLIMFTEIVCGSFLCFQSGIFLILTADEW